MRFKNILFIFFFSSLIASATVPVDTIIIKSDNSAERITRDLDSLVNSWYVKLALKNNLNLIKGDSIGIQYSDTIYERRLSNINSVVSLPYNNIIRNHIHVYTVRQREKFSVVLGMMDFYFPMIEDVFDAYGIPVELKYMAVIESALNPNAVSRMGATGLWQFMFSTGKMYGLTINSVVDERRDPLKSTIAAARYLKDLYNIFDDWTLAIAAYNCGPGNVNKAIRRSGNKKDYWDIFYKLPRETRGYLPQYVAAAYAISYYGEHNLVPFPINIPLSRDTIMVNKDIHLNQISGVMGIPLGELKALNPQYRTGLVPGSSKPQILTLPMNHLGNFIDMNDTIRKYMPDTYLSKNTKISDPSRTTYSSGPATTGQTKVVYTVKKGDNLGYISEWFRVPLTDLRLWNNIYKNTIMEGQKLAIYVNPSSSEYYSKFNGMSFSEKQASKGQKVSINTQPSLAKAPVQTEGDYEIYTVRNGDTIWDIVKKYDNVTTNQVLTLNGISSGGNINVGQKLKIRKKS